MKKRFFLFSLLLLSVLTVLAKEVDVRTAKIVAQNFYFQSSYHIKKLNYESINATMVYECVHRTEESDFENGKSVYFVFNINDDNGFVIVSGDDATLPVLGYSLNSSFKIDEQPPAFRKWMDEYRMQILFVRNNNLKQTDEIKKAWDDVLSNKIPYPLPETNTVNPLISAKWNQGTYYNAQCPGGSVTGCVATAMAQIMKYWSYPTKGSGIHSYDHSQYGTLTANFGAATYNWSSMPNSLSSHNSAVATLMYHCGVSVNMNYSPSSSGAYVISAMSPVTNCAEYAFKTYFGYQNTLQGLQRKNYTTTNWINLLKNEMNAGRPVLYAGFGSGGGHAFVCDGYNSSNYFHMNWGWGGAYDGYFSIDALDPAGLGTGGGTGGFNSGHQAIVGIQPGSTTASIELNSSITVNPNPVRFGQPYTVNADVINKGSTAFAGYYGAALFNSDGIFIKFIQVWSSISNPLPPNYSYTGGLDFTDTIRIMPGNYKIGIYYRTAAGEWSLAGGSYTNPRTITFSGPLNDIDLYSTIQFDPATFVQGQQATVSANFLNSGSGTFKGRYQAAIVDITGKTILETINFYDETDGLPSGYTYNNPISFKSNEITTKPGTYLLSLIVKKDGDQYYWYAGADYYTNPVFINIVEAPLSPDIYEPNNIVGQAYNLPVSFSLNKASVSTEGSNAHIGSDQDYYKLMLDNGYNYTITARLHDKYESGNSKDYTLDALFSYSKDGSKWSDAFDDVMPGNIIVENGGTVYFHVAPYFAGSTGTYLLDINISRTATGSITNEMEEEKIAIFPNPANKTINITFSDQEHHCTNIRLTNTLGEVISIHETVKEKSMQLDVSNIASGVYFMEFIFDDSIISRKVLINR